MLNTAFPFCGFDSESALRWLKNTHQPNHAIFILPARGINYVEHLAAAKEHWKSVTLLQDRYGTTSDWTTAPNNGSNITATSDASGPNSSFRQLARHFHEHKLGPFFFCEPDCVLLFPDSLDRLEAEYVRAGRAYMGCYVAFPVPHISGCSIYAENAATEVDLILPHRSQDKKREIAFDLAGARAILPQAHITQLIQHVFRGPPFISQEDFNTRVSKEAVAYHSNKDGSIFKYLSSDLRAEGLSGSTVPAAPEALNGKPTLPAQIKPERKVVEIQPLINLISTKGFVTDPEQIPPAVPSSIEIQRARAAKAREALAAKRATGWKPAKRAKKRHMRRRAKIKA